MKGVYTRTVIDHFRSPRNMRSMSDANGQGRAINKACSDVVHMYVRIEDDVIRDVSFKSQGCVACIAAASMTTVMVMEMSVEEAYSLRKEAVAEELGGVPKSKLVCSFISPTALRVAIDDYRQQAASP